MTLNKDAFYLIMVGRESQMYLQGKVSTKSLQRIVFKSVKLALSFICKFTQYLHTKNLHFNI